MFNMFIVSIITAFVTLCSSGATAVYTPAQTETSIAAPTPAASCYGCTCREECWRNGVCREVCRDSCGRFCYSEVAPSSLQSRIPVEAPITVTIKDPVCINSRGTLYHTKRCRHYYSSCALIEREAAIRHGARPCKVCRAE